MDSSLGASLLTLTAHLALLGIDICQIVLEGDGLELLARLHALATADTRCLASLVGNSALVLVVTEHHYPTTLGTLQTYLDDTSWTSLGTSTTGSTFLLVDNGKTCLGIHVDSTKLTLGNTVATAQTAVTTTSITNTGHVLNTTTYSAIELGITGTVLTCTVTTYHSYLRGTGYCSHSQNSGHLLHHGLAAYGA